MNDLEELMTDPAADRCLRERLSRLRWEGLPAGTADGFESRLIVELQRRLSRKGAARFFQRALGCGWEPVLLLLLFVLLAWDLLRIIGYLLG
jgi:hypothetical protein